MNPTHQTLNPKLKTLTPKSETRNPEPETLNPKPESSRSARRVCRRGRTPLRVRAAGPGIPYHLKRVVQLFSFVKIRANSSTLFVFED